MKEVLSIFEPGNAALQDKDMNLGKSAEVVNACISVLKERRSKADILFEELMAKTAAICEENKIAVDTLERGAKKEGETLPGFHYRRECWNQLQHAVSYVPKTGFC
ncbi:UNVERIFIED_CONTAM: hypothetical protein K2H54_055120 [Gekko kuhli]